MTRRNRTLADVGALTLAASILFAGSLSSVGAAASTVAAPTAVTVQAERGNSPVIDYVALGDSYAAGQGAGFYENEQCRQSSLSYPEMLDDTKHVKLIADASCSGATTSDVLSQLAAIKKNKDIELVTVTVGANDLGGSGIVATCSQSFTSIECRKSLNVVYTLLAPTASGGPSIIGTRLATTYAAIAAAAPGATIMVTGYPLLFETPPTTDPNYTAIVTINEATLALNATIRAAVMQVAATGVDIRYVDVSDYFEGHRIGSPDPWINVTGPDAFHPTAAGYVAYTAAIRAKL